PAGGPPRRWGGDGVLVSPTAGGRDTDAPAGAPDPDRPAVFVFDEPLLRRLRLSGKRLVFLAETLGELAAQRPLEVCRGRVVDELAGRSLAATWTPVPGWADRARVLRPAEVHPWPWLVRPGHGSVRSFSAWRGGSRRG
ncbi:MAG: FAD-binding domain-containing protein, partial [Jatrophihabitans sp.]